MEPPPPKRQKIQKSLGDYFAKPKAADVQPQTSSSSKTIETGDNISRDKVHNVSDVPAEVLSETGEIHDHTSCENVVEATVLPVPDPQIRNDPSFETPLTRSISSVGESVQTWTKQQQDFFLNEYPWLFIKNCKLGCSVCKNVSALGHHANQGVRIGREWASAEILTMGPKETAQRALRKKIYIQAFKF